jgi:hypothetical protein
VSTGDTSSNGRSPADAAEHRDLRDRPLFRIAVLLGVLLLAFVVLKSCARQQNEVSQDEAVAIARKEIDFTPDKHQIRYVPQGVPPVYYWAVSFYTVNERGNPARVEVVLVNAKTGDVKKT